MRLQRREFLGLGAAGALGGMVGTATAETAEKPNVLLILVDNVGYGDVGCYGNKDVKTPN
ncbi:arylsulfatase, partial [Candidatus Sumerlaeota bacterium]|nr:arylsulfatase [Candidatus Sumerlaeota bacterium]